MTKEKMLKDTKQFAEDENCSIHQLYDFGIRREWIDQDFIDQCKAMGVTVKIDSLKVSFVKKEKNENNEERIKGREKPLLEVVFLFISSLNFYILDLSVWQLHAHSFITSAHATRAQKSGLN